MCAFFVTANIDELILDYC